MVSLELKASGSHTTCLCHFKDFNALSSVDSFRKRRYPWYFAADSPYSVLAKAKAGIGQGILGPQANFQINQAWLLFWVGNRNKEKMPIILPFCSLCSRFRASWFPVLRLTKHIEFPIPYSLAIYSSPTAFLLINMTFTFCMGDYFFIAVNAQ